MKSFADKTILAYKLKFCLGTVENTVGEEENACYQHFLLSHNVFKRLVFLMIFLSLDFAVKS